MKWSKYSLKINTQAVDFVSGVLDMLGVEGIEVEDKTPLTEEELSTMYVDLPPDLGPDDGRATIRFYVRPADFVEEDNGVLSQSETVKNFDNKEEKEVAESENIGLENVSGASEYVEEDDFWDMEPMTEEEIINSLMEQLEAAKEFLDPGEIILEKDFSDDADWKDGWKKYFKPFEVDNIIIKPTWEKLSEGTKGKTVVEIDPGMAFGTGQHETTQLCITQIKKALAGGCDVDALASKDGMMESDFARKALILGSQGKKVLDVGCGSGILAIISLLIGAEKIVGVDIDKYAVENAKENFEINNIKEEQYELFAGNLLEDEMLCRMVMGGVKDGYDIVVANILADVIIPLSKIVTRFMKKDSIFICSGIVDTKEEDVRKALEANRELEILEVTRKNDWVSFTAIKVK